MVISALHYTLVIMAVVYVILFVAFGLWVYCSTRSFRLCASLGLYDYVKKHNRLTQTQRQWLDYLAILGHLVLVCGILVLIFDLPMIADEFMGEVMNFDHHSDHGFKSMGTRLVSLY